MSIYVGDRTKARMAGNAKAKAFYQAHGIKTCEVKFEGCWRNETLGNAHDRKSKNLTLEDLSEPDMSRQILACSHCHHELDNVMSVEEMGNKVRKIAEERNERLLNQQPNQIDMPKEKPREKPKKKKANICSNCGYGTGHMMICSHCGAKVN